MNSKLQSLDLTMLLFWSGIVGRRYSILLHSEAVLAVNSAVFVAAVFSTFLFPRK